MLRIPVPASRPYSVLLGGGILPALGEELAALTPSRRLALVSDGNVFPLHGERVCAQLRQAGFQVCSYILPAGEEHKSMASLAALLGFFAENRLGRGDLALALGGGVVGDLTGFAAAVYMRGMDYVQLPTTLLSAVDSSVGGKTGVDLKEGKNLMGAFHQPLLVLCDRELLATAPERELRCGFAEVIKYGLMGDAELFRSLEAGELRLPPEAVIARCIAMKAELVGRDELDRGERRKLNLGHTFAHAIELLSGYTVPHGLAVGMGLSAVCRAAGALGRCEPGVSPRLDRLLTKYGLPTALPYPAEALYEAMLRDKKVRGDAVSLVIPTGLGRCETESVPVTALRDWLCMGGAL